MFIFSLDVIDKGKTLRLTCQDFVENVIQYRWQKQKRRNFNDLNQNKTLTLQNIQYADDGTYRCKYYWDGISWRYTNQTIVVVQGICDNQ